MDLFRIWSREVNVGYFKICNKFLEKEKINYSLDRTLIENGINSHTLEYWERFLDDNYSKSIDEET